MKLKRILSTALTVVMIFTTLAAVLPVSASAAHSSSSVASTVASPEGYKESNFNAKELAYYLLGTVDPSDKISNYTHITPYLQYDFDSAYDMLMYELEAGYLYYSNSAGNLYTIYINKYTAFVYYVNNVTGQILTSNPVDPGAQLSSGGYVEQGLRQKLMSQIEVKFFESANSTNSYDYNSYLQSAARAQITVTAIDGGVRINYTIGDTSARYLLPGILTQESFEGNILVPMIEQYQSLLEEYCSEANPGANFSFFENEDCVAYNQYGYINVGPSIDGTMALLDYLNYTKMYYASLGRGSHEYKKINTLNSDIIKMIIGPYVCYHPEELDDKNQLDAAIKAYPVLAEGKAIYVYSGSTLNESKKGFSDIIKTYCPDYTYAMMYADERECQYVDNSAQKPVIRCALEYTFNDDGSLSVRLPANSITFDETVYTLESITPLKYFGVADMQNAGYIFYPDGSGMIINFEDYYDRAAINNVYGTTYGKDYCYGQITGIYSSQVSMPVLGIVSETKASKISKILFGKETVTNGMLAIVEEGDALANLQFSSGGKTHKYASVFASYNPYPNDIYDLSETISVGSLGTYTMVDDSKYTGSYVTRYVMLADEDIGDQVYGVDGYYKSHYTGMAAYYKNYLKEKGVLTALEKVSEDLPLYIEAFGSMEILDKFLTFPINKSVPLTTFEDVITIYEQLSEATKYVIEKAEEYEALAAEEENEDFKADYLNKAEHFRSLVSEIEDISNINFRLTGFANGGMKYTYPTKVKWEKACGGKDGLSLLLEATAQASSAEGTNFKVYPDFDFSYINNTELFDGIAKKGNVSKMIDNRYALKQMYDSITQSYEETTSMVISTESLDRLYTKFNNKYSKFGLTTISVATLGSDLNSNFDDDMPINREQSKEYVVALLDRMVNDDNYEIMIDAGNIYAVKYATHILGIAIDSSNMRYASYTIPFVGLVLHSYVNYAGEPINYSGSPEYDILRSIEMGASLYYIACFQNTSYLKEDEDLSQYYGVDYNNWYEDIVTVYHELNSAIGDLQEYDIVDHKVILAERVVEEAESKKNLIVLQNEIIEMTEAQISLAIDKAFDELRTTTSDLDMRVKLVVDTDAIISQVSELINVDAAELSNGEFKKNLDALVAEYQAEYSGNDEAGKSYVVNFSSINYESNYSYVTDSFATDKNYVYTDYTIDNGKVTMVTYRNGDQEVKFILNYNNYSVVVKLDAENEFVLGKHDYVRIG